MKSIVAMLGIIVQNTASVEALNALLHDNGAYIIGRMGLPYGERGIHIISIAMDAPADVIDDLTAKIAALDGVRVRTVTDEA